MYNELKEVFYDIILGHGVKRSVHSLMYRDKDYASFFIECLKEKAFYPNELKSVNVEIGRRIPGFYVKDSVAYFGYLFWEVFHDRQKRKIWGSIVRNKKGDWKYILSGNSSNIVFLNFNKIQEVDIYHLT